MLAVSVTALALLRYLYTHGTVTKLNECEETVWAEGIKELKRLHLLLVKTGGKDYILTIKGQMIARRWIALDQEIIAFNTEITR